MNDSSLDTSLESSSDVLKSFGEYDCEDEDSIIIEMVSNVLVDRAKNNKSYTAATDFAKCLNSIPGAQIRIPTEKNQSKREVEMKYQYDHYVFCDWCKVLFKQVKSAHNVIGIRKRKRAIILSI